MQTKTISLQEYNSLTSLVRKMQNSVETLIKQLDSHKMILANCINVSHLSAVSVICKIVRSPIKRFISTFLSILI